MGHGETFLVTKSLWLGACGQHLLLVVTLPCFLLDFQGP